MTSALTATVTRSRFAALLLVVLVALSGCSAIGGPFDTGTETDPNLVADGESLTVEPADDQVVAAQTDLEAGTQVAIRLRSSGDQPFLKSQSASVDSDGTASAAFNLSGVEPGSEFDVTVSHDGTAVIEADGRVTA